MLSTNNSNCKENPTANFAELVKSLNAWCPNLAVNASIVDQRLKNGQPVNLAVEDYYCNNKPDFPGFTIIGKEDISKQSSTPTVVISDRTDFDNCENVIHIVPKESILGISCNDAVSYEDIQTTFALFMSINHLSWDSIKLLTSIDNFQNQANIQYLAQVLHVNTKFFSKDQLLQTDINYQNSPTLKTNVGVGNVASSAANLASGEVVFIPQFNSKNVSLAICH